MKIRITSEEVLQSGLCSAIAGVLVLMGSIIWKDEVNSIVYSKYSSQTPAIVRSVNASVGEIYKLEREVNTNLPPEYLTANFGEKISSLEFLRDYVNSATQNQEYIQHFAKREEELAQRISAPKKFRNSGLGIVVGGVTIAGLAGCYGLYSRISERRKRMQGERK